MCRLIEAVIGPNTDFLETHSNDPIDILKRSLNRVFIFCVAFGMGGSLDSHSLDRFESIVLGDFPQSDQPQHSIFDYCLKHIDGQSSEYQYWTADHESFKFDPNLSYFDLVVPTKDTIRNGWLAEAAVRNDCSIFFTGMTGVGKSIIVSDRMLQLKKTGDYEAVKMTFSSKTSSFEV